MARLWVDQFERLLTKGLLEKSEQREDEGWMLAKHLLDLVTQSQRFVVQVQEDLQAQQKLQDERRKQMEDQLKDTVNFLNNRAEMLVRQFARDTISKRINFARLADISNRIDNTRYQLSALDLSLSLNCYFLKAVYEYIIGNYNAAKDEFDQVIDKRKDRVLQQIEEKQLSLCYYYRGLIEYNVQEDLEEARDFMNLAVEKDPEVGSPDFKSMLLRAEINFKLQEPQAFVQYKDITNRLTELASLSETQERRLSYSYLGMAYCRVLEGGKMFLPSDYREIAQISDDEISDVIKWLKKGSDGHIYTLLTLGQLAVVFEEAKRNVGLEPSSEYFLKTYEAVEKSRPYEVKEETRAKILAYSVKLVCEKLLDKSTDSTKRILEDLLSDQELKVVYSIFSKANVSRREYKEELKAFGISVS